MVGRGQPEVLAVVQARGGSKSIPRKNIRPLGGHPLIAYSIVAAQAASTVTRLIVSTDDPEIAQISRDYGAEVPFMRPAELATDDAVDFSLFDHALRWLKEHEGYIPDVVVQLRPTSPLRPKGLIDAAVTMLLEDPHADCVRAVTPPRQNPYKMWRIGADGYMIPLLASEFAEPYNMPRQKLPPTYWQTGHVDAIRYETIVKKRSLTGERVLPLLVDPKYCVDIDTLQDWARAEWILAHEDLDIVIPGSVFHYQSPMSDVDRLPASPKLVVLDFDGVLTDNRVWVTESGSEAVACDRGDGMGLAMLRARGVEVVVLSTEQNPVVAARCRKLGIPCQQGVDDKAAALRMLAAQRGMDLTEVIYLGNDVNDLECLRLAGCGVAVADAHPTVLAAADLVLKRPGGHGAVRELCDLLLERMGVHKEDNYASNG